MAVTVDQANIGTAAKGSAEANNNLIAFNTTAAVASGAMIAILAFRFRSGGGGTITGSGGSLTWTTVHSITSGNIGIWLICAFAPSGLASGTTLTVTSTSNNNDWTVGADSYLGVDTSGTVSAAVIATGGASAGTAAWSTGSIGGASGNALIGGAGGDGTLRTSTPTSPANERIDFNNATTAGSITLVDKLSISGSDSLAGTWSGTLDHVAVGAAFAAAAGGGAASLVPAYRRAHSGLYIPMR